MQPYCLWRGFSACLSISIVLLWRKFNVNRWSTDVTEQRWLGLKGWEPPCFAMRLLGLGLQSSRIARSLQSGARTERLTWSLVNSVSYSFSTYKRASGLCILSAAVRWSGLFVFSFFSFSFRILFAFSVISCFCWRTVLVLSMANWVAFDSGALKTFAQLRTSCMDVSKEGRPLYNSGYRSKHAQLVKWSEPQHWLSSNLFNLFADPFLWGSSIIGAHFGAMPALFTATGRWNAHGW